MTNEHYSLTACFIRCRTRSSRLSILRIFATSASDCTKCLFKGGFPSTRMYPHPCQERAAGRTPFQHEPHSAIVLSLDSQQNLFVLESSISMLHKYETVQTVSELFQRQWTVQNIVFNLWWPSALLFSPFAALLRHATTLHYHVSQSPISTRWAPHSKIQTLCGHLQQLLPSPPNRTPYSNSFFDQITLLLQKVSLRKPLCHSSRFHGRIPMPWQHEMSKYAKFMSSNFSRPLTPAWRSWKCPALPFWRTAASTTLAFLPFLW